MYGGAARRRSFWLVLVYETPRGRCSYFGYHIDDCRPIGGKGFFEGAGQLAGFSYTDTLGAQGARHLGKVEVLKVPQFVVPSVQFPPICFCIGPDLLVEGAVVVDEDNDVKPPPNRGFQFAQMVPEAAVAGEKKNRPLWQCALRSQGTWQPPTQ